MTVIAYLLIVRAMEIAESRGDTLRADVLFRYAVILSEG